MVHPIVFAFATGIGLFSDKFILEATNFVEDLSNFPGKTKTQGSLDKSGALAGAVLGMIIFGPLSDKLGRRPCMLLTMTLTFLGALGCAMAQSEWMLIGFRVLTGIGMGGEYPLASTHTARNSKNKNEAARNVGLLYLCGNGIGSAFCPGLVWILMAAGNCDPNLANETKHPGMGCDYSDDYKAFVWRFVFGFASLMALSGLVCRYFTTKDSEEEEEDHEPRQFQWGLIGPYSRPLVGAAIGWFTYDFVEYGLKQNDAHLFAKTGTVYGANSVFLTRISCIPSLILATFILQCISCKVSQSIGFIGCGVVTLILAIDYESLHDKTGLFNTMYMVQYSFQMFMGVTTMAIAAQAFPEKFAGTGAGIAAALGKVGATIGTYLFSNWGSSDKYGLIFAVTSVSCAVGLVVTFLFVPAYNANKLRMMQQLSEQGRDGDAAAVLYQSEKAGEALIKDQV